MSNYTLSYTMFGKPARVFPFAPNWASPVNETLEWKTAILKSRNGDEQRRQLRLIPRRSFEYSILRSGENAAFLESLLWGWQHKNFALPVWTDGSKLLADSPAGTTSLTLDTQTYSFATPGYAIIFVNHKNFEVVEINEVHPDHLVVDKPLQAEWLVGTTVYPIILGHLGMSVQTTRHSAAALSMSNLMFQSSPDNTDAFLPISATPEMYDGHEVITHRPNWGSQINNDFTRQFDIVDAGVGPIGYFETETTSRIVRPLGWFLKSRSEIVAFRSLMGRLSGQAKTCWIPSWHDDFEIAGDNTSNQATIVVKGTWFAAYTGVDPGRNRLMITLPNGSVVYRRITAAAPNFANDTTVLHLDSTLGTTVCVGDNSKVRLILRCRLATDKIVIPWRTNGVADPQTTFTTVKV